MVVFFPLGQAASTVAGDGLNHARRALGSVRVISISEAHPLHRHRHRSAPANHWPVLGFGTAHRRRVLRVPSFGRAVADRRRRKCTGSPPAQFACCCSGRPPGRPWPFALVNAGSSNATRMAMMAITSSSSMSVNARPGLHLTGRWLPCLAGKHDGYIRNRACGWKCVPPAKVCRGYRGNFYSTAVGCCSAPGAWCVCRSTS